MYAPIQRMLVVVKPPRQFYEQGLAQAGEMWTLHGAVYGLKISPRTWGDYRDNVFDKWKWFGYKGTYRLIRCLADTQ
eukprot:12915487-Prorocentrum_lima.AAC.1